MSKKDNLISSADISKMHGNLKEAIKLYKQVMKLDPTDVYAMYNLGDIYYILGDINYAIKYLEKVIGIEPNYNLALYRLGIALFRATRFSKAIKLFDRIIAKEPDLYMAYYWKGLCYYHRGNIGESIKSYAKLQKANPKATLGFYQKAVSLKAAGRYKEAVVCLEKITAEDTGMVSAQYHLGLSYLGLKDIENAMKAFKKVIELNPDHHGAKEKIEQLFTDQETLYSYGIVSKENEFTADELTTNFHVGQTYKGMAMIEEALKHFKNKTNNRKKED